MDATKTALVAGTILGALLVGWVAVMAATGWYRDPALLWLFWVGVAAQAVVLVATLARTRPGRRYGAQIQIGLGTSAVAAVLVFVGTLLVTGVAFPRYSPDLRAAQERTLRDAGIPPDELEATLEKAGPSHTPGARAFAGFMGTLGTGLLVSLVAAAALRDRERRQA